MQSLFTGIQSRKLYGAAAIYAASAWVLIQITTQVFPFFNIPNWSVRLIIVALVIGFPFAMLLVWFNVWTPATRPILRQAQDEVNSPAKNLPGQIIAGPPAAGPATGGASIAVLPFADMSEKKDQEYFSDGLAEELLNLLAQLPQLRVIARTSSFSFRGKDADLATIARALDVATVLEGSVRKSGNMLRITAQLIRTADSSHLWSQTYDRELTDIFKVQDEIAGAVVDALKVKLLPNQHVTNVHRTTSAEAHEQYLLGQDFFRRGRLEDFERAVAAFRRAVAIDPHYAAAAAGVAMALSAAADFTADPAQRSQWKNEALATAEKTIAMAPDQADGYVVRAQFRYRLSWDWKGAEADFRQAVALDPNSSAALTGYSLALHNLGRMNEALAMAHRAIAADPLWWAAWMVYAAILRRMDRLLESRGALEHALETSPDSTVARFYLGIVELEEGQAESAIAHFRRAGGGYGQAGIAMAEHTLGHEEESRAALHELETRHAAGFAYQIAGVHAWRGEKDAAFAWLDRAVAQHDSGVARMRGDPELDSLKDDPRYAALIEKLGLPDPSTGSDHPSTSSG
ncbi:MAG TPA: tetratricopeptide repeat protein [Rhizomicrobium sp.]|jgi:serine/threonine-protein kinase